jgi:hypothetical protein
VPEVDPDAAGGERSRAQALIVHPFDHDCEATHRRYAVRLAACKPSSHPHWALRSYLRTCQIKRAGWGFNQDRQPHSSASSVGMPELVTARQRTRCGSFSGLTANGSRAGGAPRTHPESRALRASARGQGGLRRARPQRTRRDGLHGNGEAHILVDDDGGRGPPDADRARAAADASDSPKLGCLARACPQRRQQSATQMSGSGASASIGAETCCSAVAGASRSPLTM